MTPRDIMIKQERRNLDLAFMTTAIEQLYREGYDDCMLKLTNTDIMVDGLVYTTSVREGKWTIQRAGDKGWEVSYLLNCSPDHAEPYTLKIDWAYCQNRSIIAELSKLVIHILTTYHPDGRFIQH